MSGGPHWRRGQGGWCVADLRKLKANSAWVPYSEAEFEKRIRSICERIGVNPDIQDRTTRYAVMGLMFCLQQPEFGRGKGRPRKTKSSAVHLSELLDSGLKPLLEGALGEAVTD